MTEKESFILQLYEKYYNYLIISALIYDVDQADADDLVQDVFEIAIRKVDTLMKHHDPRGWLVKTLENLIKNYHRLHANRFTRPLEGCGDLPAPEGAEPLSHVLPAQLSDSERQILIWRVEERADYREIGRRLGISENYCRVKMSRLLIKCRKLMEE